MKAWLAIIYFKSCLFTKAVYKDSSYTATENLNAVGAKVAIIREFKHFTDILLYFAQKIQQSQRIFIFSKKCPEWLWSPPQPPIP
jgi:hypothetical protein